MKAKDLRYPPKHAIVYGDPGLYKSHFAASWPKPMLVLAWDARGKEYPYLNRGDEVRETEDEQGTEVQEVFLKGKRIIRIEHYAEGTPEQPESYERFMTRMVGLHHEYKQWRTIGVDSVTGMELASRWRAQFRTLRRAKDPRKWYGASKEDLERMILGRFSPIPCNVVLVMHLATDKDEVSGQMLYNPHAPGKLSRTCPAGYTELYRVYRSGGRFLLQTEADAKYNAMSSIPAPNPCEPSYKALWGKYKGPKVKGAQAR